MERLRLKKDFQIVFRNGKKFFSPYGASIFTPRHGAETRMGIIVGVKTARKAVVRNRIRRRIREAFRRALEECPLAQGMDIVLLPKATVLDAPFESLKKEMARFLTIHKSK